MDSITIKDRHIHEECGVFGIYSRTGKDAASMAYYGLFALQHRGQEGAGIVINEDGMFRAHKGAGLVNEVFDHQAMEGLGQGHIAVGHVRYGTTGGNNPNNIQPLLVNHYKGSMALCHNGNLINAYELRRELERNGSIFHTTTDSEAIAYMIVQERLHSSSIEEALAKAMNRIDGAYSLVIASPSKLIAARDPYGFRPLCMGELSDGSVVFASESCALDAIGARFLRDLLPGEIVVVDEKGVRTDCRHCQTKKKSLCVFEYIYFARPDSVIDGSSVHEARRKAGMFLAKEHPVEADVVIGVPDSGLDGAIGYAQESGIPYTLGFVKNKYIGRTFIAPSQGERETAVQIKLNVIKSVVEGKRVVLIDDSIVRGTTCRKTIDALRSAGAKEIHMRVTAPPFVAACYYGTDIDDPASLIANQLSVEQIADLIHVDSLGYLSIENVKRLGGSNEEGYCTACFGGECPTRIPVGDKHRFEVPLSQKRRAD